MSHDKLGVALLQFGGPDSPQAVLPFLINLFSDPDILDLPLGPMRPLLARMIAYTRAAHVRQHYAAIGGHSPIRELTGRQAGALQAELTRRLGGNGASAVAVAMRYWEPSTASAVSTLAEAGANPIVLLPLYPQFCRATTTSSLREWERCYQSRPGVALRVIHDFHDHPGYIRALVENVRQDLRKFPTDEPVFLLFSAHGVPQTLADSGDPYTRQVEATTRLVLEAGAWQAPAFPSRICYQSRVGPQRWVGPSLMGSVREIAAQGVQNVLVIPISFVSDHVETLCEINIEARSLAMRSGIRQFEMMSALNDSPLFIAALADLALARRE